MKLKPDSHTPINSLNLRLRQSGSALSGQDKMSWGVAMLMRELGLYQVHNEISTSPSALPPPSSQVGLGTYRYTWADIPWGYSGT